LESGDVLVVTRLDRLASPATWVAADMPSRSLGDGLLKRGTPKLEKLLARKIGRRLIAVFQMLPRGQSEHP
jgi:hypothetical protein